MTSSNLAAGLVAQVGESYQLETTVPREHTAAEWGNDLPVLATPVLLWLSEIACMRVADDRLDTGLMTLGLSHDSAHLGPTREGETVTVRATLNWVGRNRLGYRVVAHDHVGQVLDGTHVRAVVSQVAFTHQLKEREDQPCPA